MSIDLDGVLLPADIKQGVFHLLLKFRDVPLDKTAPLPPAGPGDDYSTAGPGIDAATGAVVYVTDENAALAVAQARRRAVQQRR
jgi:hypothetical protein